MPSTSGTFQATEDAKAVRVNAEDLAKTIFAWRPMDKPGVSREVTEHIVNINPGSKLIKQGLCHFNEEKRKAICEELANLLTTGFVNEV
jgi:hypothetical protein